MTDVRKTSAQLVEEFLDGRALLDGQYVLRYKDVASMLAALSALANKALPTREARTHVARCVRALQEAHDEYRAERLHIDAEHALPDAPGADNKRLYRDISGMEQKLHELGATLVLVTLPTRIEDRMLPTNDKAHPNNEDALAAILADLGPLYPLDE